MSASAPVTKTSFVIQSFTAWPHFSSVTKAPPARAAQAPAALAPHSPPLQDSPAPQARPQLPQ
jgi:hypothetical protein